MPFAFARSDGALFLARESLPDAAENGSGNEVTLTLFSDTGVAGGEARVKKIVKSESRMAEAVDCR